MEGEVGRELERRCPVRHDEFWINGTQAPIEHADQTLHRCTGNAKDILDLEQAVREGQVGQQAHGEGGGGQGEADDGEVLQMPAIGIVDGVGVDDEVVEGVGERGQAD